MDPIDELLAQCLSEPEATWAAALDRTCAAHPQHASELRRRFARVQELPPAADAGPERIPERLGEFRILRRLGGGGMGVVYLAEQQPLGRTVALKLIRPDQLFFPGARERFQREVEAVARLSHPGIVPVYTVGEAEGIPYFAMEHVRGASLEDVVRALPRGPATAFTARHFVAALAQACGAPATLTPAGSWADMVVQVVLQVAEALAHAHDRGVLHRDLKPSNIMLTPAGECRLLDFGLASAPGTSRLTRTGAQMGSLPFMAPEQAAGQHDRVDRRTDGYALGVTLYELLTGRLPFAAESHSHLLRAIAEQDARDPRALNPSLSRDHAAVVLKALEKDPERRYQSAFALADDLRRLLTGRPVLARPIGRLERGVRWARREPAWAALAMLLAVALPAGAALLGYTAATHEAAVVGRARQRAERIEQAVAQGFVVLMSGVSTAADAERRFDEALALDPSSLEAVAGLGLARLVGRGGAAALEFLDGEARALADNAALRRLRAFALRQLGRHAAAEAVRSAEPPPASLADRAMLAEIATQDAWEGSALGPVREALGLIQDVILLSPQARFLPYARQAQLAARVGDVALARRTVVALQTLWPQERLLDFVVGSTLARFDPAAAVQVLRRYVAANPDPGGLVNLSGALDEAGAHEEAREYAERALALGPDLWQTHLRLARSLLGLQRGAEAVPHFVRAVQLRTPWQEPEGLPDLIALLRPDPKRHPEADRVLRELAEQRPDVFTLQANVGAWLGMTGRARAALPLLRRAVALRPESVDALASLGAALQQTDAGDEAEEIYLRAIQCDPRHFAAHYNLGVLRMRRGELSGAETAYRNALALRDDAEARNNLGMVLGKVLGPEAAVAEFRRALELDPTLRPAHSNLLRQLRKLGDEAGAAAEEARWEQATSRPASRR